MTPIADCFPCINVIEVKHIKITAFYHLQIGEKARACTLGEIPKVCRRVGLEKVSRERKKDGIR
jgi:hypothetical protein